MPKYSHALSVYLLEKITVYVSPYVFCLFVCFFLYHGLKEEPEKMWRVKTTVVPVVIEALGAMTPKLGE